MNDYNIRLGIYQLLCAVLFGLWQHSWFALAWFISLTFVAMHVIEHWKTDQ
jgi:hypothetical protein